MVYQVGDMEEGAAAVAAPVGTLAGVRARVPDQLQVLHEGAAALAALLAGVDALMLRDVGALAEGLAALGERKRLVPGMREVVLCPRSARRRGIPALAAHTGLLAAARGSPDQDSAGHTCGSPLPSAIPDWRSPGALPEASGPLRMQSA